MLRTQAMPPTLSVLGNIPILIKSRVPKPRTCVLGTVPQSALLRLPIFLCVQKKKTGSAVWNPVQGFRHFFLLPFPPYLGY